MNLTNICPSCVDSLQSSCLNTASETQSSYVMIILQHALENLFQVADLKEQHKSNNFRFSFSSGAKWKKRNNPGHIGFSCLLKGTMSYPVVSQITLRRQLAPLSSLILPSHASLNQEGSLLMRAREDSSDKDNTFVDMKIHRRPQGNGAVRFASTQCDDIWIQQFIKSHKSHVGGGGGWCSRGS